MATIAPALGLVRTKQARRIADGRRRRGARCVAIATGLLVLGVAQLSCTLAGTGIGLMAAASVPGPYEMQSVASAETQPLRALEQHGVARGDRVSLHLRGGRAVEGTYRGVRGPSAVDRETYVLIEQEAATRLAEPAPGQQPAEVEPVATSEIESVGVEVTGYGWLAGTAIGVALDVLLVYVALTTPCCD